MTPDQQRLAAAAIDVLTSLSKANLTGIRRADRGNTDVLAGTSLVPRWLLRDLADALETAYPGALDDTIAEIDRRATAATAGQG